VNVFVWTWYDVVGISPLETPCVYEGDLGTYEGDLGTYEGICVCDFGALVRELDHGLV
jgi:hypothetical protein